MRDDTLTQAFAYCRNVTKNYSTSYYLATHFFPKRIRTATYALYSFYRQADELVDNPISQDKGEMKAQLTRWRTLWQQAYNTRHSPNPILHATAQVMHEYQIPLVLTDQFLDAMEQDLYQNRYDTYDDLQRYMDGSAGVVGIMMSYVIGFKNNKALAYAQRLGYAMQLTNFLRDMRKDYEVRGRIYVPLEEVVRFGVSEETIAKHEVNENFRKLMQFQIRRIRGLYQATQQGILLLQPQGQRAVRIASRLYESILDQIEEQGYDVFTKRVSTPTWRKLMVVTKGMLV